MSEHAEAWVIELQTRLYKAEAERDSWVESHAERDKLLWAAEAERDRYREALREIEAMTLTTRTMSDYRDNFMCARDAARAALADTEEEDTDG
jgi:hypothetical protein